LRFTVCCLAMIMLFSCINAHADQGIKVVPESGVFEYKEDFRTSRFLNEGFPIKLGMDQWRPGAIFNLGPESGRTLVYRFYSTTAISDVSVSVDQRSNGPNLGGSTTLFVSKNGMDWVQASSSLQQKADAIGWQSDPLVCTTETANQIKGNSEVWIKLVMDNTCGLPTGESSIVSALDIKITTTSKTTKTTDPYASAKRLFSQLSTRHKSTFTSSDPRLCYLEDVDGALISTAERPVKTEPGCIYTCREYAAGLRIPLASALFINTKKSMQPLCTAVTLRCSRDSSRKVAVIWNGKTAQVFDTGSFIEQDRTFYVRLSKTTPSAVGELRIAGLDSGAVRLVNCDFAGGSALAIVPMPVMPAAKKLKLLDACYIPDPLPPADSQAVEGRQEPTGSQLVFSGLQKLYKEHSDFGAIRIIIKNTDKRPVLIKDKIDLNGRPIESSYVDFVKSEWDARGVVWYRVRPRTLAPGECGQIYIRFRRHPDGNSAAITINPVNSTNLNLRIPYIARPSYIDYITADKSMQNLYIYVRGSHLGGVKSVSINANPVIPACVKAAKPYGDISCIKVKMPGKLKIGTYMVVQVRMQSGNTASAQFRVLPFWFPKTSYHIPPDICQSVGMNLTMWYPRSLDECRKYNIYTNTMDVFTGHERTALVLGPDEPDANDNVGGGYDRGLGYNARRLVESGWQELIQRFVPQAASWLMMDGTTRPLNWAVYSQIADICAFDPYPVTFYGADHYYVGESLGLARTNGAPNRMYACLEAYGWGSGQGVPAGARGPSTAEYKQSVVQAIGAGAKGLTSWVYVAMAGGWQNRPDFKNEILRCNRMISRTEDLLILGTPVNGVASTDAGQVMTGTVNNEKWEKDRVRVSCLMCGPENLVITAVNHIPASVTEPVIKPAENVKISVKLPDGFTHIKAFEATDVALIPIGCTVQGDIATIQLDKLESGRVFVIKNEYSIK